VIALLPNAWRLTGADMNLSREARLFCGVMLLTVPTIMHGGATLLGILTRGGAGVARGLALDDTQWALFRAGHAHAGVWAILSLFLQVLLDATTLSTAPRLVAKPATPIGAILRLGRFLRLGLPAWTPTTTVFRSRKHDGGSGAHCHRTPARRNSEGDGNVRALMV
jgi:hypothetical protein